MIRRAFEDKPLIYKPSETEAGPDWHKSTDCLWTSVTGIPGKKAINNDGDYDGLETFFARTLGVQRMTLRMLYDKLRNTGQGASVGDVRNDLIEFNALLAAETLKDNPMSRPASDSPRPKKQPKSLDPVALWKAPIFPVRRPDGQRELVGGQSSFHIVDRELLEDYFRNKATLLDFTMDEARSLKPLIQWIGLDNRYLSTSVREISTAETASTRPISEPTRQISKKAGSLLR